MLASQKQKLESIYLNQPNVKVFKQKHLNLLVEDCQQNYHYFDSPMKNKNLLWKNIGKQVNHLSSQSSISSYSKPKQSFQFTFEDEVGLKSQFDVESQLEQKITTPRKIQDQVQQEKHQIPKNINAIQLDNNRDYDNFFAFKSDGSEYGIETSNKHQYKITELKNNLLHTSPIQDKMDKVVFKVQAKLSIAQGQVRQLKQSIERFSQFLINLMAQLKASLTNYNNQIIAKLQQEIQNVFKDKDTLYRSERSLESDTGGKVERLKSPTKALHQQIIVLQPKKRQMIKISDNSHQLLAKQFLDQKRRLESQLNDVRQQCLSNNCRISKLKEALKQKDQCISCQAEELRQLYQKKQQYKIELEECISRQKRSQLGWNLLKERSKEQIKCLEMEIQRQRQECLKLRELLRASEEQLSQSQLNNSRIAARINQQEQQKQKIQTKARQMEIKYCKKLQEIDKQLIEMENSVCLADRNSQQKLGNYHIREQEISNIRDILSIKQAQISNKEAEIQQLKCQYLQKLDNIQQMEEGMRAEYSMAVKLQNATKERWYQRYNATFTPQRQKNSNSIPYDIPERDVYQSTRSIFTGRQMEKQARFPTIRDQPNSTQQTLFQSNRPIQKSTKTQPTRQILFKARSQKHLGMPTSDFETFPVRKSQKQLINTYGLTSNLKNRINSLRSQLSIQLGQINNN